MRLGLALLVALLALPALAVKRRGGARRDTPVLEVLPGGPAPTLWGAGHLSGGRGETVTTTRATVSTCSTSGTGSPTVTDLASGAPCVEPKGLLVWGARTNLVLRSEEFDNASWQKNSGGGTPPGAPTVTADSSDLVAPDGSQTAEKIVFPAVSGAGNYSLVAQTWTATAAAHSWGVWLRTLTGTATVYVFATPDGSTYHRTACSVTTTWSRCLVENKTLTALNWNPSIGVDLRDAGQSAQSAQTVYAWGYQINTGAVAAPYCPTTSAAATCNADQVRPGSIATGSTPSMALTFTPYVLANNQYVLNPLNSSADRWQIFLNASLQPACSCTSCSVTETFTSALVAGTRYRISCSFDGAALRLCVNDVCESTAATATFPATFSAAGFGHYAGTTPGSDFVNGHISDICFGNTPGACR